MEKTIICGDTHIKEKSIPEIETIFRKDIMVHEAHTLIQLGDYYDSNYPSPLELKFGTDLAKKLKKKYKEVIILSGTGNHDIVRGNSVVEYLQAVGIKVVKGDYSVNNYLFGHWMTTQSKQAFGTGIKTPEELSKFTAVFLGHQHLPEVIKPNIFHLGSIRYVSFAEVGDIKGFAELNNDEPEPLYHHINHCMPMYEVHDLTELDKLPIISKVRLVIDDFDYYKTNAEEINRVGKKYFEFKIKMNFEKTSKVALQEARVCPKNEIIEKYLANIKDKEVKQLLQDQFKEIK